MREDGLQLAVTTEGTVARAETGRWNVETGTGRPDTFVLGIVVEIAMMGIVVMEIAEEEIEIDLAHGLSLHIGLILTEQGTPLVRGNIRDLIRDLESHLSSNSSAI